jgi:hypothetical protein
MEALATALRYETLALLIGLISIIGYRLLIGKINTDGLLKDKTGDAKFSPGRLQMLVTTVSIALYYVFMVLKTTDTGRLPDMPTEFLVALAGSHAIYLGGKLHGMLASKIKITSSQFMGKTKPENGG